MRLVHQEIEIARGFSTLFLTPLTGGHELVKEVEQAFREANIRVSAENLPNEELLDDLGMLGALIFL